MKAYYTTEILLMQTRLAFGSGELHLWALTASVAVTLRQHHGGLRQVAHGDYHASFLPSAILIFPV